MYSQYIPSIDFFTASQIPALLHLPFPFPPPSKMLTPTWALPPVPLSSSPAAFFAGARRPRHAIPAPRRPGALRMSADDLADVPLTPVTPPPPKRPLDELVDFPCVFTFKIVGINDGDFLADITSAAAAAIPTEERFVQTAVRDRGKYRRCVLVP